MPCFRPAPAIQTREAVLVVVAARADHVGGRLGERGPAELGGEEDERVVEQAPPPEVAEQAGDRPVDPERLLAVVLAHVLVAVPVPPGAAEGAAGEELDEPDPALEQARAIKQARPKSAVSGRSTP